jgi:hypothetical protein
MKTFFAGGIYRLIICDKDDPSAIKTVSDFLKNSSQIWPGFLKTGLFSVLIYGLALFLGLVFGDFLGRFWSFLRLALPALFLFLGSIYLQILKIHIAWSMDNSLKTALRETRERISGVLLRIIMGNASVALAAFVMILIFWFILKAIKSSDWSVILMIFTIVIQQIMVFTICLAQTLRINFNYSVIKKGEENALGGDELGRVR